MGGGRESWRGGREPIADSRAGKAAKTRKKSSEGARGGQRGVYESTGEYVSAFRGVRWVVFIQFQFQMRTRRSSDGLWRVASQHAEGLEDLHRPALTNSGITSSSQSSKSLTVSGAGGGRLHLPLRLHAPPLVVTLSIRISILLSCAQRTTACRSPSQVTCKSLAGGSRSARRFTRLAFPALRKRHRAEASGRQRKLFSEKIIGLAHGLFAAGPKSSSNQREDDSTTSSRYSILELRTIFLPGAFVAPTGDW
ncbi:uncharacterized protein SCHCODRAFT_02595367 [Schizophyllum commune H4-8]|uniref:Uncharacterized protein n=1 Tax=Schizophyllum commune (strain H4-8 / FGSC 9210) TaxID=578458 RepID=D8PTN2_SCHCM|nr:uncharacterized protein SCHCODRAFT_02595367 [Schizophyllum commune H4-8]KAI5899240.1 hypothetical protein SCHCODRAFT_02595367 [Schizophyllum commune H4-8]